jgi:hypothetical protein
VPREHPLPSALKFGSFLGSHLWSAPAGVHYDVTFVRYPGQSS